MSHIEGVARPIRFRRRQEHCKWWSLCVEERHTLFIIGLLSSCVTALCPREPYKVELRHRNKMGNFVSSLMKVDYSTFPTTSPRCVWQLYWLDSDWIWSSLVGWQGKRNNIFVMLICPDIFFTRNMRVRLTFRVTRADVRPLVILRFWHHYFPWLMSSDLWGAYTKHWKIYTLLNEVTGEMDQLCFYLKTMHTCMVFFSVSWKVYVISHLDHDFLIIWRKSYSLPRSMHTYANIKTQCTVSCSVGDSLAACTRPKLARVFYSL